MDAARRAAARRAASAPERAEAEASADAVPAPVGHAAPDAAIEQTADEPAAPEVADDAPPAEPATVSGIEPGTLVVIESLSFAGRIYEPGQPLPPTFPADVAERRIADGSVARM